MADWLKEHGDDKIAVKLIDLLTIVARLEQVKGGGDVDSITEERIYTCDLPRLRSYLPAGALEELQL